MALEQPQKFHKNFKNYKPILQKNLMILLVLKNR